MGRIVKNLVFFKAGWVACVMFAAAGEPGLSALSALAVAIIHLLGVPAPRKELLLLLAATAIGFTWESLLVLTDLVSYPGHPDAFIAPYWIVAMWVLFATTVNHGLSWAKRNPWLGAAAGLIGGPMAFYGGMNLGAVEFSSTAVAMAIIGLGWAILLPVLTLVSDAIIDSPWLEPADAEKHGPVRKRIGLPVGYE